MFAPPNQDAIDWLENEGMQYHRLLGPTVSRSLFTLFEPPPSGHEEDWDAPAHTTNHDLDDCRFDSLWNERV